jgi:hypothetical protein
MKSEDEVRALLKKAHGIKLPKMAEDYRQATIDVLSWVLGETHGQTFADDYETAGHEDPQ